MLTLHMFTFQKKKGKKFHKKICFGVKDIEKILSNHHLYLDHKFWETFDPYPILTFFYAYKLHFLTPNEKKKLEWKCNILTFFYPYPLETIIYKSYPNIFRMKKKKKN